MRYYDTLLDEQRGPFQIIVDKTWEDLHPRDLFEEEDVAEICTKIDQGVYDWFMLRVRVMYMGVELAEEFLGGCCYEDAREVLTDGTAEDQIYQALLHAQPVVSDYKKKFAQLDVNSVDALLV
jgi:hypothetical protein